LQQEAKNKYHFYFYTLMKQIYVLRHANWNLEKDDLTKEGKQKCADMRDKLPAFDFVISSSFQRNIQTTTLLGKEPEVDKRAGVLNLTDEQNKHITQLRKTHNLGVVGAIFDTPELIDPVKKAGELLIQLIKETISKLPPNGKALIISHDGTMISAEMLLQKNFTKPIKTYDELEGYIVDEQLHTHPFGHKEKRTIPRPKGQGILS